MLRYPALLLLTAACLGACSEPTGVSLPGRARLVALVAPEAHPTLVALTVHVTFELGYCDHLVRVLGRNVGGDLEVEVRTKYELSPGIGGCIDIGPTELTAAIVFPPQPAGTVTIRGLQPEPLAPLERTVIVAPE